MAPQYQSDFETIDTLKDRPLAEMRVGEFSSSSLAVDQVSVRGSNLVSPFGGSYSAYVRNALSEELKQSSLWDDASDIVIEGELLQNDVDAYGISVGTADLSARFRVYRRGQQVYDKVHSVQHEWESSLFGNVAVPNAVHNYPLAVQKLINAFLLDTELLNVVAE
jgi:hypothetical protein